MAKREKKAEKAVLAHVDHIHDAMKGIDAGQAKACPTFTLRADRPGHLWALRDLVDTLLDVGDRVEARRMLREFDLWEEEHRACR